MKQRPYGIARSHALRAALGGIVFLAGSVSCSSQEEPAPELETTDQQVGQGTEEGDGDLASQGDVTAVASNGQNQGVGLQASESGEVDAGEVDAEDGEDLVEKEPIAADPYDDDWNNLGSQQQQKQQQVAKQNVQTEPLAENQPALQNTVQELPPEQPQQQALLVEEPPLDMEPAPMAPIEQPVEQFTAPVEPAPVAAPEMNPVVSGAPLLRTPDDVEPTTALLHWVGYDFAERDGVIRIEMVTRGNPKYNIFQERNQADQPELVVRFFNTALRDKVRRDIDASEFRSPVAYVRMRPDDQELSVDVVITMRDAVQPRMYTRGGNVMLTFPIPDHYFGNSMIGSAPVARAEVLANANIMPELDDASDVPEGVKIARAFINNPAQGAFPGAPTDGGAPVDAPVLPASEVPETEPLPADFSELPPVQGTEGTEVFNASSQAAQSSSEGFEQSSSDFQGSDDFEQGFDEEIDFEGQDASTTNQFSQFNQYENAGFDGEPAPAQQASQSDVNFNEESDEAQFDQQEFEETDDALDDESLEDFDDGEGESNEAIDKFDVRLRQLPAGVVKALTAGFRERSFSLLGVAQDSEFEAEQGFEDEGFENEGFDQQGTDQEAGFQETQTTQGTNQQFNQATQQSQGFGEQGDFANGEAAEQSDIANGTLGETSEGDFPAAQQSTGNGNLLGEGGQGNVNPVAAPMNSSGGNFPAFDNSAPINTTTDATWAAPVQATEPPLEMTPDFAGPETEGQDTEVVAPESAGGRPVMLDFRNAPLKDVIRVLSDESGVNFVLPGNVGDMMVNVNLSGVPFNDALRAVLETNQLGMSEMGPNLVRIDTLARLAADKQAQEDRLQSEKRLRPTKILVHRLSYAPADDAVKMIAPMLAAAGALDKRISVQSDKRTNSVIVNAPPSDLAMIKALLERVDLETPQVKIASRIIEIIKTASDSLGISWGGPFNYDQGRGLGFGNMVFPNNMVSRYSVDANGTANNVGNLGVQIGSIGNMAAIDLALAMEEKKNTTEILQSSDLLVEDNQPATISAGSQDNFVRGGGEGGPPQVVPITYDLSMSVTPHITADGAVQMKLNIVSDSYSPPNADGAEAGKTKRSINTSLLRKSGETAVIGGIYATQRTKGTVGIPGLSSIPIIGALFRSKLETDDKRELIVMVTPTIVSSTRGSDSGMGVGATALNSTQNYTNDLGAEQSEGFNLNGGDDSGGFDQISAQGSNMGLQAQQSEQTQAQQFQNQQQTEYQNEQTQNQQYQNQQTQNQQFQEQQQTTGQQNSEAQQQLNQESSEEGFDEE